MLVRHKMLRLLANILAVNDKYYVLNTDNLPQPIQMQLYRKKTFFSPFFLALLKSLLNFKHLPKEHAPFANVFLEIPAPKNMLR